MDFAPGVNFPPKFCVLSESHRFSFGALNLGKLKGVDVLSGSHRFGFGAPNLEEWKGIDVLGGDVDFALGVNLPSKLCVLGGLMDLVFVR